MWCLVADFPSSGISPNMTVISVAGQNGPPGQVIGNTNASLTSQAWGTANKAIYVPFIVERFLTIQQIAWNNAATIATNLDVGIYDYTGTQLVHSGSTAHAGASAIQVVDITDTPLDPGLYYVAMVFDGTTQTIFGISMGSAVVREAIRVTGVQAQTSAFPLPASATFAALTLSPPLPLSLTLAAVATI